MKEAEIYHTVQQTECAFSQYQIKNFHYSIFILYIIKIPVINYKTQHEM